MPSLPASDLRLINPDVLAREIAWDIESDFVLAPHYAVVFKNNGKEFVETVLERLRSDYTGPMPPTTVLVPKARWHFRPGAILEPVDRVVYHAMSSLALDAVGKFDGNRAISAAERALVDFRTGTDSRHGAWGDYAEAYERLANSADSVLVLDLAHYFEHVPQHALVNLLEDEGLSANAKNLTEHFLSQARMRESHGILQGMLPSDYFGDLFLRRLDGFIERAGYESIRFVDDVLVAGHTETELRTLYRHTVEYLRGFGLQPNESKTRIVPSADALREHTALDDLFHAARDEVIEKLGGMTFSYGLGLDWTTVREQEATLTATKRLLAAIDEKSELRQRILRFVLRPLAAVGDREALPIVLDSFSSEPHLARDFARYAVRFADDADVISAMSEVVSNPDSVTPYQLMHAVAVLSEATRLPRPTVISLIQLYGRPGEDSYRALAAIAISKFGDGTDRQDLASSFQLQASEYIRSALIYAAKDFVAAARRTAKSTWVRTTRNGREIASRVLTN